MCYSGYFKHILKIGTHLLEILVLSWNSGKIEGKRGDKMTFLFFPATALFHRGCGSCPDFISPVEWWRRGIFTNRAFFVHSILYLSCLQCVGFVCFRSPHVSCLDDYRQCWNDICQVLEKVHQTNSSWKRYLVPGM